MITNVEIRSRARSVLNNNLFSREWLFTSLMVLIISIINGVAGATAIGALFITGPASLASAGYFLHLTRNQIKADNLADGLECVKRDIGGSILTGLVWSLAITIGSIFFIIPLFCPVVNDSRRLFVKVSSVCKKAVKNRVRFLTAFSHCSASSILPI